MIQDLHIYSLFACALLSVIVTVMVWKRWPAQGVIPLMVLMSAIAYWSLFQALGLLESNMNIKIILANLRYFGIELAPVAFYALAYEYKDKNKSFSIKNWFLALIIPFIMILFLWTNPLHHLFYTSIYLKDGILILESGSLFWVNMSYLYIFILISVYLFIRACISFQSIYRKQAMIIAGTAVFPVLANLAFNFNIISFKNIDLTPFAFLASGLMFFYALFQYKLLDVIPVARDRLIEEMDDAIILLDNNKRILDLNKGAKTLILGASETEIDFIGENILGFLNNWHELADFISNAANVNMKINYQRPSGVEYYHLKISNIYDKKGRKSCDLIVLRNITELEEALQEAKNATKIAETANKAKDTFLANMSHEIRTPMNAIIGISEILDTTEMPKEQQKSYIRTIVNSAESLLIILNDILDFSKLEAGRMKLERQSFNLGKLIAETVENLSVLAVNKSLIMTANIDKMLKDNLIGDPIRVKQILTNLMGNAIKFTKEGSLEIQVKLVEKEARRVIVDIQVKDTGIGIPEEKLDTIFESFKQADSSTTRIYGGTGLGLTIVKELVEMMGGTIHVESKEGKGSRFYCRIPFDIDLESNMQEEPTALPQSIRSFAGLKVLVAEDNKINRDIIRHQLAKLECIYDFAENGQMAIEKYQQNKYDIIFMDVQMPVMGGLEATQKIRALEQQTGEAIPIVALTAGAMKDDVDNCIKAGMNAHLSKPIKLQKLQEALSSIAL